LKANGWTIQRIPKDGHCLFESFARAFRMFRPELPQSTKKLRLACAEKMMELNGQVPNWPLKMFTEHVSGSLTAIIQPIRTSEETLLTLEQYCKLLSTNLYGGQEEIMLMVTMYRLQVNVYADSTQKGQYSEIAKPHTYCQFPDSDADTTQNAGNFFAGCIIKKIIFHFICQL
jgi:hypothetical protein